ncbi:tyrosine-type recombinase/integrase [Edaphobacter albus]|uniref:tyrosine-type recombinase/integrase n=1 Tax=Edaphobacter sp. 4G125 TaxID=2763071 RepID=UPI00164829FF|nr:tyrosine-type recombinase/integrase [Edaphobacter sp. 4G125]QNI37487.1 tyrosine-type recombinase/integrase [Edaphobacter sp. 4G125]
MERQGRYQAGTIEKIKTSLGPCWYIRFTETNGKRPRFRIGLLSEYSTEAKASRAAQLLRDQFNGPGIEKKAARTFGDVIDRYEKEEMPKRYSTRRGYSQIHRNHIRPKWGPTPLEQLDAMEVRKWLLELDLAPKTKGNILGQMRSMFRFAMLWKWIPASVNPMSLFTIPGVTKRRRKPRVINASQFWQLMNGAPLFLQTAMIGAYCLGLRVSELFALQWQDFDFLEEKVWIRRAIVESHTGEVKTERSEAPLPLAWEVMEAFLSYYHSVDLKEPTDWVFASPLNGGKKPRDSRGIQTRDLSPAGDKIDLGFNLGWHTFRHSYKVLLERAGADLTVQRDLMRHADTHTTSQVYGEVEFDRMRTSNNKAVALAFAEKQKCPGIAQGSL